MKKTFLLILLIGICASACSASAAGKWAVSIDEFMSPNIFSANVAMPFIIYNCSENSSFGLGYISTVYSHNSSGSNASETFTYSSAKYTYYFGRENFKPHVTLKYLNSTDYIPGGPANDYLSVSTFLTLLVGSDYHFTDQLSVEFDLLSLSSITNTVINTDTPSDKDNDYQNATFINILPEFDLKWTF